METIGDRIRKRRKELGLTQGAVGKLAGLATATISDMENGRQRETTKSVEVAKALQVRAQWLTSGELPMLVVEGAREAMAVRDLASSYGARNTAHGVQISREGALVGAEWDKIEGDEYRRLAREFIEGLVAAQKRSARRDVRSVDLTTGGKSRKNKRRTLDTPYSKIHG